MATGTIQALQEAIPHPPTDLPEEDGVPLESDWHRLEMNLLIETVTVHNKEREDYFVGGNMFIYFSSEQVRNQDFRGPDFFYVKNAPLNPPRRYWAIWDEKGKYPDVIIELSSPTTAKEDHGVKKDVYEGTFRTPEYFIYDPDEQTLQGWRLDKNQRYKRIQANDKGWLWSEQLGLWLGTWICKFQAKENVYLRFFEKDGTLVPTDHELRETEGQRADAQELRAETERQRADAEKERADAEKKRADAVLAELEALKKQMNKSAE